MARVLAILALALSACSVDVEGAPCRVAGSTQDCPSGQACGPGGTCSKHVGDCVAAGTFCVPGGEAARRCNGSRRERCAAGDDCGVWALEEDCGAFSCDVALDACRCPDPGPVIAVDPAAVPAGKQPTGALAPAACRFGSLRAGLSLASAIVSADAGAAVTVSAVGGVPGATTTFSAAGSGETFPLEVPGRVTLTSDAAASGATYEIVFDDTVVANAALKLYAGATLARLEVRNQAGGAEDRAVLLDCSSSTAPIRLDHVVLDGKPAGGANRLDEGVAVDGPCAVEGTNLDVRGMAGAAIAIADAGAAVTLNGGTLGGSDLASRNGVGVALRDGALRAIGTRIEGNERIGIDGNDDFGGTISLELSGAKIVRNGDTGIALRSAAAVKISDTTVFANSAVTSWGEGIYPANPRRCGGVVLWGSPPNPGALEFQHNRVYANSGDQVAVLGSGAAATWGIEPQACLAPDTQRPLFNVFSCYDPSAPPPGQVAYRGLVAISANASARRAVWQSETPSSAVDVHVYETGSITLAPFCQPDATLSCTREDPILP